jgi:uncharacterized membrane protein YfcA
MATINKNIVYNHAALLTRYTGEPTENPETGIPHPVETQNRLSTSNMENYLVSIIIFLAVFTQSFSGFGVALVAMALLPSMVGIQTATPLVALVAFSIETFLLVRYRSALNLWAVMPVALASIAGIPLGIWLLKDVKEGVVLTILGSVIAGYAIYALFRFRLPNLHHPLWAWGTGLFAGILGGAYNTSGPPVILYGNCKDWPPAEFKSNLQGFFLVNSAFVALSHALSGNLNAKVWSNYLWAIPAMVLGVLIGTGLDKHINPDRFRRVVLWLLVLMGIRLIFI